MYQRYRTSRIKTPDDGSESSVGQWGLRLFVHWLPAPPVTLSTHRPPLAGSAPPSRGGYYYYPSNPSRILILSRFLLLPSSNLSFPAGYCVSPGRSLYYFVLFGF